MTLRGWMLRHRAIYAPPPRRFTFMGYGVLRRHEHYFNVREQPKPPTYTVREDAA